MPYSEELNYYDSPAQNFIRIVDIVVDGFYPANLGFIDRRVYQVVAIQASGTWGGGTLNVLHSVDTTLALPLAGKTLTSDGILLLDSNTGPLIQIQIVGSIEPNLTIAVSLYNRVGR